MDSSIRIEEKAGEWLARRDSDEWNAADQAELTAWLDESTAHIVAFVRLEKVWEQAKRLKALSAGVPAGEVPAADLWRVAPFFEQGATGEARPAPLTPSTDAVPMRRRPDSKRRSVIQRVALAASAVLAVSLGNMFYQGAFGVAYRTPIGGLTSVPISDGSKVTLNTDSKVRLAFTETQRRVELDRGEAFFEVAKDPHRPFIVEAGSKRVIAVGTRFSVRRSDGDVRVVVTEGTVRIEDDESPAKPGEERFVTAGGIASLNDAGILLQEKTVADAEGYLSWRAGYLLFSDDLLADAVAEFNRYSSRKIVIEDANVAAMRVSGKFRTNQVDAFVRLLEGGFSIRARQVGDSVVLTDGRKHEALERRAELH